MRLLPLLLIPLNLSGQYTLYSCASSTKEYVVGAKLPPTGLFLRSADGEWRHEGYNLPFLFALDYDSANPETIYLAAGNGLFRAEACINSFAGNWTNSSTHLYRSGAFNAFNRTNFGVNGTVGNPNFGRATSPQYGPRITAGEGGFHRRLAIPKAV